MKKNHVIVVEGTDGSGKSFIISKITPWLEKEYNKTVVYNHLRPNWLPDIAIVLGKRSRSDNNNVVTNPHEGKQSGSIISFLRWGWYMLDYTIGHCLMKWKYRNDIGNVFIFDRYYYEFYLDQKRSHVKLPFWLIRLGEKLLPKPDLILCLGGDPEIIFKRKPETTLEEVALQTSLLQKFCKNRKTAIWVDTTTTPAESITKVIGAVRVAVGNNRVV